MGPDYASRIAEIGRTLGIPSSYAASRGLSLQAEVDDGDLTLLTINPQGREVRLVPSAARKWEAMSAAAAADQSVLLPLSGFRSVTRQAEIIREKLSDGKSLVEILRLVAAPGYSEHHTGCALDLGAPDEPPLEEGFAQTAAFAWLKRRAGEFGFHLSYPRNNPYGITFEPWHWCWREDDKPPH
jgi:D-alanyl-D-alanine carboxypeptidase